MSIRRKVLEIGLVAHILPVRTAIINKKRIFLNQSHFLKNYKFSRAARYHTCTPTYFYESLNKISNDKKFDAKDASTEEESWKMFNTTELEWFESDPERYYFVKMYSNLSNRRLEQQDGKDASTQNNSTILREANKILKPYIPDIDKPIHSVSDLDLKLDVLLDGLKKVFLLTEFCGYKDKREFKKQQRDLDYVRMSYMDLSCSIFDQICDTKSDPNVKQLLFSLAYIWLRVGAHLMNISATNYGICHWNEQSKFLLKFVSHYIARQDSRTLSNLDPQEFLFCMFVVGLHRRLPGMTYQGNTINSTNMSFVFPKILDGCALSCYNHISITEVGLLSRSLLMANLKPGEELRNEMFHTLLTIENIEIPRQNHSIKQILQTLSRCETNIVIGTKVMLKYTPVLEQLNIYAKVRLGAVIAKHCPDACDFFVEPFISSLINDLQQCRMKDLHSISCCLVDLKWSGSKNESFCDELMKEAVRCIQHATHINDGRQFISFIFKMSCLSYYSERVLNDLIEKANHSEKLRASKTEKEIWVHAAPDIFSAITGQPINNLTINKSDHGKSSVSSMANATALKQIALLDSQLDDKFHNYKGERLQCDIKRKLLNINLGKV